MLAMGLPQQYSHDYVIQHYQLLKVTDGLSAIIQLLLISHTQRTSLLLLGYGFLQKT